MDAPRGLLTLDIDAQMCAVAQRWIERAGLQDFVRMAEGDSRAVASAEAAREYLGGAPALVFVDSSHEYGSTLAELDSWYGELAPGGLIVLHDASEFAASFDVTREGGVQRALREWRALHPGVETFYLNSDVRAIDSPEMIYQDFCGAGLIQKPLREG